MTTPAPTAAQAAAAALGDQARTLVAMAAPYRAGDHLAATKAIRAALLADQVNDRDALATGAALLAVLADAGEIGTPFGKLVLPAGTVVASLIALEVAGCQTPESCPGTAQQTTDPVETCTRCAALTQLEAETGLTGRAFLA